MVRTKDSAGVKVAGAKAARKITAAPPGPSNNPDSKNKYSGGNPYCPRETPSWQKPITQFFGSTSKSDQGDSSTSTMELEDDNSVENGNTKEDDATTNGSASKEAEEDSD